MQTTQLQLSFPLSFAFAFVSSIVLLTSACSNNSNHSVAAGSDKASATDKASAVTTASGIRLNQLGFLPNSKKLAVVPATNATHFSVIDTATKKLVLTAALSDAAFWAPAEEKVKLADFSELNVSGDYQIRVEGFVDSYPFTIAADQYKALNDAVIKAFYYNRAGMALTPEFAGKYARAAGHPDTNVQVHPSAASILRPEGTVISSPKGWYDAGDYNKYIVNSGISTYTMLAAFEHFPDYYKAQNLNIPESGDAVPDLLNEVMWNIEWMLTMQDPNDGGVYHKLTDKKFSGMVMPDQANTQRYVVQKSTAATLNFAAVMATASRVFTNYESSYPGLSAKMLLASKKAWVWAKANPNVVYKQPEDVKTGEYGDAILADEFAWAAAELYITTKSDGYYVAMNPAQISNTVPAWAEVNGLAWISLAHHRKQLTAVADQQLIASRIDGLAGNLLKKWQASAYGVSMETGDFIWGSNAVAANQAMMLIQGYRMNGNGQYLDAAQSLLDYLLGRNPTDYSYVTGYGDNPALFIHHRPAAADGIEASIPGFLAGGPQPGLQDKKDCGAVVYPSTIPAKAYLDHECSFASNEIAINWNAPLVYVSGAIQALTQ
ncbi:MAG: glycoside hydrolase family 9 protein [Pseudomonadota bacterium]